MIFYFSGTGNTRWAAHRVGRALNDRVYFIPDEMRHCGHSVPATDHTYTYTLAPDECVGFAFPVYAWQPPQLVVDFISRLRFTGNTAPYCYFLCTCGDDIGQTQRILQQALHPLGLTLQAGLTLVMPDCYISLPGFDIDSDEERAAKLAQAPPTLDAFIQCLKKRKTNYFKLKPGVLPRIKTYVLGGLFRRFLLSDKPFFATEACIGCGKCAQACPIGNIHITDKRPHWQGHCTGCLACYHTCPFHAVQYGKRTKGKGQYLHKNYVKPEDE